MSKKVKAINAEFINDSEMELQTQNNKSLANEGDSSSPLNHLNHETRKALNCRR